MIYFNMPRAAMIPVAAAPVMEPERPAASPATKRFLRAVWR